MSSQSASEYQQEGRYQATVMVVCVQGFSSLAGLDARVEMASIKETWLRIDRLIAENGGYPIKHTGDLLLAVWGLPSAEEGDAERAVKAAVALQEAIKRSKGLVLSEAGNLQLKIGINSGSLYALRVGINSEYTLVGETVKQTFRLAQLAQPGTILVGDDTFRKVHEAFQLRKIEQVVEIAEGEALIAYQVEQPKTVAGKARYSGTESMQTRMVGRDQEISRLQELYEQALQGASPLLVLVVGADGFGKSRLLMEFTSQLEAENPALYLMASRALAQTVRVPFYLWKSLWQNRFGMVNTDAPAVAAEKFMREVQRLWGRTLGAVPAVEAAHLVGSLIGLEWPGSPYLARFAQDAQGRVVRGYDLTRELLHRAAVARPTVMVLDDLQWADQDSLDLLSYLLQPAENPLPLLIIGAARPEFLDQKPDLASIAQLIALGPLPVTGETVAAAYPHLRHMPHQMLTALAQYSGGNPYFLEEIVRSVLRSDNLQEGEDALLETLARLRAQPPESLEMILRSRLGDLARMTRAAAMLASISGRVFWVGAIQAAVRAMVGKSTNLQLTLPSALAEQTIEQGLRQLVQAELAFPRANSSFSSEQEYIFKHDLLRDVAYSMIPVHLRKQYHFAVGSWMSERQDLEFIIMAADQFEMAGAMTEAVQQCERAAALYEGRGAIGEAQMLMERARLIRLRIESAPPAPAEP